MTNRVVKVTIEAAVTGAINNVRAFKGALGEFGTEIDKLATKSHWRMNSITNTIGGLGLGLTAAFGLVAKSAMSFDKEMSAVGAVADATGAQLTQLRDAALAAGRGTVFTATEAAQAEEELSKAGISASNILSGALTGALSLAAAGNIGLADAATIAAQTMNEFGLKGTDVGHIADVLASAANKSAADMQGLGDSLRQGGLIAAEMGISFEDTTAVLAAFADRGLVASDAGTSLKTMLQKLQSPSQQAADAMKTIGLKVYDASGQFVGITKLAQNLHDSLLPLTQAQRDYALSTIFGTDATRGASVLMDLGAQGLKNYRTALDQVGAAQDTARKKMDNLSGDLQFLKGSVESLTIGAGGGATGGLRGLAQGANRVVESLSVMPKSVANAGTGIAGIAGATALGAAGFLKARDRLREFQQSLEMMGPVGAKAAGVFGTVTGAIGKLAIAMGALQIASAALGHDVNPQVATTVKALEQFAKTGDKTGEALSHLDYDLGTLGSGGMAKLGNGVAGTIESLTGLGSVFDESLLHARERISAIDTGLTALATSGHADEAAAVFDKLAAAAKKQGISLDDLKRGLPQYQGYLDGATASQQANIAATKQQVTQFDLLHESLSNAIDDVGSLKGTIDALNGKNIDTAQAQIAVTNAVDGLAAALKNNGNAWDTSTTKGAANTGEFIKGAQAARDLAQAVLDQTGDVNAANDAYKTAIKRLDDTAHAHGATKTQVDALNAAYAQIPPLVSTTLEAPGLSDALNKVISLKQNFDTLNGRVVTTTVTQNVQTGQTTTHRRQQGIQRWGGLFEHAAVGVLRDAGIYGPANPARYAFAEPATHGEAFIPKNGNLDRSRDIWDYVGRNWLGTLPPPAQAPVVNVVVSPKDGALGALVDLIDVRVEQGNQSTALAVTGGWRA